MGMFGSRKTWQTIGAALQDIGDIRGGGPGTAVRNLQAMREQEKAKQAREAYMAQFGDFLGGQSVGEAPMTPGIDGSLEGMGPQAMPTAPQPRSRLEFLQNAIKAPEGVDVRALSDLYEASLPPKPQAPIRASAGDVFIDPVTGKTVFAAPEKPEKPEAVAIGYRPRKDGMGWEYIPGGPADPRVVSVKAASGRAPPRAASGGGVSGKPIVVGSKAQRDALPPGTSYKGPDGVVRIKR